MGCCMTRLDREMEAPPQNMRRGHRRRVESIARSTEQKQQYDTNSVPLRRETASGIPGLSYDQAGRPV